MNTKNEWESLEIYRRQLIISKGLENDEVKKLLPKKKETKQIFTFSNKHIKPKETKPYWRQIE